jgi:phosphate-selective porin OprO/OprP
MKINVKLYLSALASIFAALSSYASNDALLDLLVKKGVLSQADAQEVQAELTADAPLAVKAKGKETIELRFNGRVQGQFDGLAMEGEPSTSHFYFRRLFLGAKAKLQNGVFAETVFDFARDGDGGDAYGVNFDKAIVGYTFNNGITGTLGYQKVPFGFEETTSSSKLQTIERSAVNRFFADDIDFSSRHMGLHAKGKLGNGFSYAAALANSAQGEGSRLLGESNSSNDLAVYGRLQWKKDNLLLGLDAGQQTNNTKVGTADQDVSAFTTYANYKLNDLNLLGEYFSGDLGESGDVAGYALRASYRLGSFEPVVRYAFLKADSFEIDTDELIRRAPKGGTINGIDNEISSFYLGANYYYSKAVTFMAGYEQAEANSGDNSAKSEVDGFRARVQVLW